jgi:hypothetical protein
MWCCDNPREAAAELDSLKALNAELLAALELARMYVAVEGSEEELAQVEAAIANASAP